MLIFYCDLARRYNKYFFPKKRLVIFKFDDKIRNPTKFLEVNPKNKMVTRWINLKPSKTQSNLI